MLCCLLESKLVTAFLLNWMFMILIYETVVLKKLRPVTHGDPKLHAKYPAFRRDDAHLFTNRLLAWLTVWMVPFKLAIILFAVSLFAMGGVVNNLLWPE